MLEMKWRFTLSRDALAGIKQRAVQGSLVATQQSPGDLGEVTGVHGDSNMGHATL